MRGKTHAIFGIATALTALLPTNNIVTIIGGTTAAAFGSIISDIDAEGVDTLAKQELRKAALTIVAYTFIMPVIAKFSKLPYSLGTITLSKYAPIGFALIALFLIIGFNSKHRHFTHSIEALIMSTAGLELLVPTIAPWYALGFITHTVLDMLNRKKITLSVILNKKFCLNFCDYNGIVDKVINIGSKCYIFVILYIWLFNLLSH